MGRPATKKKAHVYCPDCECPDVQVNRSITMKVYPSRKTLLLHTCAQCRREWYGEEDA